MHNNPQMYSKILRQVESCEQVIHAHRRDYNDQYRMLYTGELEGIDSQQTLKEVLYSYEQILKELKDCKLMVMKYQKEGEDE